MELTKFYKKVYIIFTIISFFPINLFSQNSDTNKNNLSFELGNNIYGNSITIGYNYSLSKHFFIGLAYGEGYFQYYAGRNILFVKNIPGKDNFLSIDFKQNIDLVLQYRLERKGNFKFFDKFVLGFSYSHFLFKDQFTDDNVPWSGEKDFSWYLMIAKVNCVNYSPDFNHNINFDLGLKAKFTLISSPIYFEYDSPGYKALMTGIYCLNGATFSWLYPELYLRINYDF